MLFRFKTLPGLLVCIVSAFCALSLFATAPASALEQKTYMGAFCHPDDSENLPFATAEDGTLRNIKTSELKVICPIVKSVTDNAKLDEVNVYVDHGSTSKTTSCTVNAYSSTLTTGPLSLDSATLAKTFSGVQEFKLGVVGDNGVTTVWGASEWVYYEMTCTLAPGARLRNYYVNENGNRNESRKTYAPSMCRVVDLYTTSKVLLMNGWIQPRSKASNDSASLVCPIITDRKANTGGAVITASVGRPINTGSFSCTAYASGNTSNILDSFTAPAVSSGGSGTEFPTLTRTFDLDTAQSWARYHLACSMPGSGDSKLISYRVEERGSDDSATADGKVYPGSVCSGNPFYGLLIHNWSGSASNINVYAGSGVWCPIVMDHYGNTAGLSRARAYIQEMNQPGSTTCTAYSYTNTGTTPFSSSSATAVEPSGGASTLEQQLNMPLSTSPNNARYYLGCNLSAASALHEYEIEER